MFAKVALVLLSIAAFVAAAPANSYDYKPAAYSAHQTYDHKPAYNHKEYDYVRHIFLSNYRRVRLAFFFSNTDVVTH